MGERIKLIIKYSFIYVSGIITGFLSPIIYMGIKNPIHILKEILN
jgi:hypothetical protein